jgi:hypothetical protein
VILQKTQDRESLEEGAREAEEGGQGGVFESSWMGSDNAADHWFLMSSAIYLGYFCLVFDVVAPGVVCFVFVWCKCLG